MPPPAADTLPITVALEGGGSLGAFAWGVLDRLLDVPGLRIDVVSGTSAGAMNGAMLVQGLAIGGKEEAKRLLETFWRRVAIASGSLPGGVGTWLHRVGGTMAPMVGALRQTTSVWTPTATTPTGLNPLRGILAELLEPAVFARPDAPVLVVAATRLRTGEACLFRGAGITAETLLASACLPNLFPTVEIDGEAYWDGGYASNPPLRPLVEGGAPPDVLIVRTTPLERPGVPTDGLSIQARANEITFTSALRQELRSFNLAQRLLADAPDLPAPLARLRAARLHMIGAEDEFRALSGASKLDSSWAFLSEMRGLGHAAADRWLTENSAALGSRSTLDLSQFAGPGIAGDLRRAAPAGAAA